MDYKLFYESLLNNRLISLSWKYVLDLINDEIKDVQNKDKILNIFSILFSFVDDGNIYISLEKSPLITKILDKFNAIEILLRDQDLIEEDEFLSLKNECINLCENHLDLISENNLPTVIGKNRLFQVEDKCLYIKKHNDARKKIIQLVKEIFSYKHPGKLVFKEEDFSKDNLFKLSKGQLEVIDKGINNSLIITGGPGSGKTTSILYLLINILKANLNVNIHLAAPSGKAANRMKESIIDGLNFIDDNFKQDNKDIIDVIANLKENTIHKLLEVDYKSNAFKYNEQNKFGANDIFVIDEASMIDINLFVDLLQAIPNSARIYFMGDKDQLPSVDAGAVFGDLLGLHYLNDNIAYLKESNRFKEGSDIYNLAYAINNGLPLENIIWKDNEEFKVEEVIKGQYPVHYYLSENLKLSQKDVYKKIVISWGNKFYKDLQKMAFDLDEHKYSQLDELYRYSEIARILTAENEGIRGVKRINAIISANFIDKVHYPSINRHYVGELMMINTNNRALDLNNGDCGILVSFKGDNTVYFMVKKTSELIEVSGKKVDTIFKLGEYYFYPLRFISNDEIDLSYAITIHKSQGSGYSQILVVLPTTIGHPLLNRQILYTAITRTKGNTYIISKQEMLECARDTLLRRDTNIN